MGRALTHGLAVAALIAVAACNRGGDGSAPSGQVVATIGGDEITQRELNAELNGFSSQDQNATKQAQQAALNAIVNRKLFARAARDASLDKSAEFQLARQRSEELMLAQAYQQQVTSKAPRPTEQEINDYISQHPNTFAQRKIYVVDRIVLGRDTDKQVLDRIKPLHSMDEIEQALLAAGVEYVRAPGSIDARQMPPQMIDQITRLASEPFVLPSANAITINQVKESRTVPLSSAAATALAEKALTAERNSKAVQSRMAELRKTAGEVKYQPGYEPPAPGSNAK